MPSSPETSKNPKETATEDVFERFKNVPWPQDWKSFVGIKLPIVKWNRKIAKSVWGRQA